MSSQPLPTSLIAQAIPRLTRFELAHLAERLIERLDEIEPDSEAEDSDEDCCLAGDDGCGPFARHGFVHWGSVWEDQSI